MTEINHSEANNPFDRGYHKLRIERELLITYEADCEPAWRPLHASQAHLVDDQISRFPCLFNDDFALVTEKQIVPYELQDQCPVDGIVSAVVYAVMGERNNGQPVHVGDLYSEEAAREVVRQLTFETGVYGRCWEISAKHITEDAFHYLAHLADIDTPTHFLFVAFRLPYSPAIGVKLLSTPWTDAHLLEIEGIPATRLFQHYLHRSMPASLMDVLRLAGRADVRMLVFDADAPVLDGLPVYDR